MNNEYVLDQVNEKRKILNTILKKRWRGKPRIIMLDDIKADETYKKINCRAMDREC